MFEHIRENARTKDIFIDHINGTLITFTASYLLGSDQTIEKVMQLIKGESSFWINQNGLTKTKFVWQDEYFVVSVHPGGLQSVRRYIANQEEHHKHTTFDTEYADFLFRAGFQRLKDA